LERREDPSARPAAGDPGADSKGLDGASGSAGDGKGADRPAPLPFKPGKEYLMVGGWVDAERTPHGKSAKAGLTTGLMFSPRAIAALPDGSLVAYHGDWSKMSSKNPEDPDLYHKFGLAERQLVHLYRDHPRATVWRYQVIPRRELAGRLRPQADRGPWRRAARRRPGTARCRHLELQAVRAFRAREAGPGGAPAHPD
jgi:hypothetical protein